MFAYCLNNPVCSFDPSGSNANPVGAGVQFEVSRGNTSVGIEVILYWDVEECIDGAPVIAVYVYGGVSIDVNDPFLASIVATITDNSDLLLDATGASIMTVAALIGDSFSVGVSGVLVIGNDQFVSTKSYEESFSSVGGTFGKSRGSIAYSESCTTFSAGYNIIGGSNIIPKGNVSKTYYQQLCIIQFGKATSSSLYNNRLFRENMYAY